LEAKIDDFLEFTTAKARINLK